MGNWGMFWLMLGMITVAETIVDYLVWKTKIEYGIKDKKSRLVRFFTREKK